MSLSLLILLIILNFSDFTQLLNELFSENPEILTERKKRITEKYYYELQNEKDDKLTDIINNKSKYKIEYVLAAQKLIEERRIK